MDSGSIGTLKTEFRKKFQNFLAREDDLAAEMATSMVAGVEMTMWLCSSHFQENNGCLGVVKRGPNVDKAGFKGMFLVGKLILQWCWWTSTDRSREKHFVKHK